MPTIFEQFYLGCLAHASYLVGSNGAAAVIDPQRDVDIYLEAARRHDLRIQHVIETHLHADFVSGHRELSARTGARIYLGAAARAKFDHVPVRDGDFIDVGALRLEFLETPGHTLESICIVQVDDGKPSAVFTGDTLFVGDVGRPDLAADHTPQELAGMLFDSIHRKLLQLPDDLAVYPAHGAGSLCGRQMSSERASTIGKERRTNYALQAATPEAFIQLVTADLPPRPEYFSYEVELNRQGATSLQDLPPLERLTAAQVAELQSGACVVLDTRPGADFAAAHLPGSIHIALSGQFASWAARILGVQTHIIVVGENPESVRESQVRLARVGIENLAGSLDGGLPSWIQAGMTVEHLPHISVQELATWLNEHPNGRTVVDVRETAEWTSGVIPGAVGIPLGQLAGRVQELNSSGVIFANCKGGYRSSIASSLLRQAGFRDVVNVTGGFDAWRAAGLPVELRTSGAAAAH